MGIFNTKWPFYLSGAALALVAMVSLYVLNDVVGMGPGVTAAGAFCLETLENESVSSNLPIDYGTAFLIGILIGGFIAAIFSGNFKIQLIPDAGGSFTGRLFKGVIGGFTGGFLVMVGVQLAGETVYGQMVAAMQLSPGAWIYLLALVFSGGFLALLFDRRGGSEK